MYFNDHNPPHFHVQYNDYRASLKVHDAAILEGELPARVVGLVAEWANLHREELMNNWETLRASGEWAKIPPLV